MLKLLVNSAVGCPQRRRSLHIAIGRERLVDGYMRGAAMICAGKLIPVVCGRALILHLRPHRRCVRLTHRHPLGRPGRRPQTSRSAVVAYMGVGRVHDDRATIDVVHQTDINVVD